MIKRLILTICLLAIFSLQAQTLHLYAGDDHTIYLGCLNCSNYDKDSIWNEYGIYGNTYNGNSIWNDYGKYGNSYNTTCPWNSYASKPPVVVDKEGNFYGYFAVNEYQSKRANFDLALIIYKYHNEIKKDVGAWYDEIFK